MTGGPLSGLRILEFAGMGPGPFCAMMLADHGAEVIRIDRPFSHQDRFGVDPRSDFTNRSRRSIVIDLKMSEGVALVRTLVRSAHGVIEGFRPGVMERLGLGPDTLLAENPRLVYGRMTGWGQTGPLAPCVGHDLNYIALSGALHGIGPADGRPVPPINLVGDYGGGAMMLAFGMLAAINHVRNTGEGQVVDAAMIKGAATLTTSIHSFLAAGNWTDHRGVNTLDGGAPFYDTYETADGLHVSIAPIEPVFYGRLLALLGEEEDPLLKRQEDRASWPAQREKFAAIFKSRTRAEWDALLAATDACYAPVLSLSEAVDHPQNVAVGAFVDVDGYKQPAPSPVYSRSVTVVPRPLQSGPDTTRQILSEAGYGDTAIACLTEGRVVC
ncbi:alpha-methylacyl-CoA racemase [Sphingobium xenophagum]|uniref:Alpha-methylacyl-CoA racemase n=1 Tax=Sphingobium xenophagum TaxID=121428 RepID=A0ABU1X3M4_SPHXE|nr:CaiB/BaiF CoA-transferase family protein [Sphingobium xenophagum]MDR7155731.1 alpha-methylacyl-CoA racemase [Sphingobium xenophagum]